TFVVSFAGEAAVSGVSLVNAFNTIFLYLFTALASGGAVVVSQYLGRRDGETASRAVSQLLTASALFSLGMMVVVLALSQWLLRALFGSVEPDVMAACVTYLRISAYSYPAIAVYNAGAALYRSVGRTRTTMMISILANVINVIGNCIGVFWLRAGVAGVAWPSLIARTFSAVAITALCFKGREALRYERRHIFRWDAPLQKSMLRIAIPNGLESGVFQLVKVALSSVVAMFGTAQIAANGIAQSFWSVAALMCITMGPVFITVIGQAMGAGDTQQAERDFRRLMKITLLASVAWNALTLALTPLAARAYAVSDETRTLVLQLVLIHNIFNGVSLPFADPLGKGLRAAGDIRFTTGISIFTTVGVRLVFSYLFAIGLNMGVIGIAWAMCLDWTVRGAIYAVRFHRGKWKTFRVIQEESENT
ncbi:MAG: MATE family efflux transporter, partial [Eubacteriales bacterium]|nr:MATE family efflux transporter [Eubacteriales bacterium]